MIKHFIFIIFMLIWVSPTLAQRRQFCERTNYSSQEIADAVRNSSLRDELKKTSCTIGGLGRFESNGNKGIYNGSCCTGILQLTRRNIANYADMTPEQFGCQSLQFQIDAWARLTNDGYNTSAIQRLISMGGTFDGQKIDAAFIAACIQLGPGNCNQMVQSGRCSGFADRNGTTICDMARNARSLARNCTESQASCEMGPGDFPTPTPVAGSPPLPVATDVMVPEGAI
jgi:hypothetical protein